MPPCSPSPSPCKVVGVCGLLCGGLICGGLVCGRLVRGSMFVWLCMGDLMCVYKCACVNA